MDDIPQEVLYDAFDAGQTATLPEFLRLVAQHHTDRAERLRALRKKSWQSQSRELDGVADHIRAYADQLEQFAANNPSGERPASVAEPHPDAVPGLPGNTGRCAAFRRAAPGDEVTCTLDRGHDGDHGALVLAGPGAWPRTPSGAVCGDVVILPDGTALNCARPLGHDGDEHYDGRYQLWPRGVGTSRYVRVCDRCNMDTHTCPGCGEPVGHFMVACAKCAAESEREAADGVGGATGLPAEPPLTTEDELFPGQCEARQDAERCMLPGTHTGKHKGRQGSAWDRRPEPVEIVVATTDAAGAPVEVSVTLGDIAEQQRAALAIPEQRETVENVETEMRAELAVIAAAKEEVTAIVDGFVGNPFLTAGGNVPQDASLIGNPFAPPANGVAEQFLGHPAVSTPLGAPPVLGNPFQTVPAPPPEPPAAFLPPHMVPGAPKAHQSHSSITTMEKCGLQYRLKYRDGIGDDTPAWWNVAGTAFHTVVQAIESQYATALAAPDAETMWATTAPLLAQQREAAAMWKEAFSVHVDKVERESGKARSTWKAAKVGKEGEAWWREYGGDLCRMYAEHRRRFLAEPEGWRLLTKPGGGWAHEVEFNATVDGVLLKGFIDAAWISADGTTILIEDFKSGSSEGDPFQPKLYGAALRALGFVDGRRVVTRFYEARKGAHSATVELTGDDDAEVSYRANTAQAMDRAGIFPPNPSGYNCSTCPVKSRCPIMATKG